MNGNNIILTSYSRLVRVKYNQIFPKTLRKPSFMKIVDSNNSLFAEKNIKWCKQSHVFSPLKYTNTLVHSTACIQPIKWDKLLQEKKK